MEALICHIQDEHNEFTALAIRNELKNYVLFESSHPPPLPARSTIQAILQRNDYTTKVKSNVPVAYNNESTKLSRYNYVLNTVPLLTQDNSIWMDETGFAQHMSRTIGRSKRGTRAHQSTLVIKGVNVSVIAALQPAIGIIYYEKHTWSKTEGGVNKQRFEIFFRNLLKSQFLKKNKNSYYLLMDNYGIHNKENLDDIIRSLHKDTQFEVLFIAKYSPFLNPIEYCFNIWKRACRQTANKTKEDLHRFIDEDVKLITEHVAKHIYAHVQTFYPLCNDMKDL